MKNTKHPLLTAVIRRAKAALRCRTAVGRAYAASVITGASAWSGADLQGRAREYWRTYKYRREDAAQAVRAAGGDVLAVGDAGQLYTVVRICIDDYGDAIYATPVGLAKARRHRSRRLTTKL